MADLQALCIGRIDAGDVTVLDAHGQTVNFAAEAVLVEEDWRLRTGSRLGAPADAMAWAKDSYGTPSETEENDNV